MRRLLFIFLLGAGFVLAGCASRAERIVKEATSIEPILNAFTEGRKQILQDENIFYNWYYSYSVEIPGYYIQRCTRDWNNDKTSWKETCRDEWVPPSTRTYTCDIQVIAAPEGNIIYKYIDDDSACGRLLKSQ